MTTKTKNSEKISVVVRLVDGVDDCYVATVRRQRVSDGQWLVAYVATRPDAQRARDAALSGAGYVDHHGRLFRRVGFSTTIEAFEVRP